MSSAAHPGRLRGGRYASRRAVKRADGQHNRSCPGRPWSRVVLSVAARVCPDSAGMKHTKSKISSDQRICAGQRYFDSFRGRAVCKTVGSAYVGSNPTPATPFPQVKAGVTGWWHRFLRAGASGSRTVGGGFWASCGPDSGIWPLFDPCSSLCFEQGKWLLSTILFRGTPAWCRRGSAGRRWAGREIHGRIADGLGARRAVGVAAGFRGIARSGVTAGFPRTGTAQVLGAAAGRG